MYPVYLITCSHLRYGQHIMPYVGCVTGDKSTVLSRFADHMSGDKASGATYLRNAVKKYGKEWFKVEQIDSANTPEQALELENWWIKRLGTKRPYGYNLNDGGEGNTGFKFTDEQRQHLSSVKKGITPTSHAILMAMLPGNNYALGKHWTRTPEANAKLLGNSQATLGGHTRWHVNRGIKKDGCALCQ